MATSTLSPLERFLNKVQMPDDLDGCWLWVGAINNRGYGNFRDQGKTVSAHRFAYEHFNGQISGGLHVCHHCDTPNCVNPAHLFLGTRSDNMRDCVQKGRNAAKSRPDRIARGDQNGSRKRPESRPRGETSGRAKLTNGKVKELRRRYRQGGVSIAALANEVNMHRSTINDLINGRSWKHLDDNPPNLPPETE